MSKNRALQLVLDELDRALAQHPKFNSPHEAYAVILEELDELWVEVKANNGTSHRGVSEAVQVAAMALRYLTDLCDEPTAVEHERKVETHKAEKKKVSRTRSYLPISDTEAFGGGYSG